MYVVAPADPIYHIAKSETRTLCGDYIFNEPDQRRRYQDQRLVSEPPKDRVCVLCSKCALLSGDSRSFEERITYPSTKN
jgi:hypothetical protein